MCNVGAWWGSNLALKGHLLRMFLGVMSQYGALRLQESQGVVEDLKTAAMLMPGTPPFIGACSERNNAKFNDFYSQTSRLRTNLAPPTIYRTKNY